MKVRFIIKARLSLRARPQAHSELVTESGEGQLGPPLHTHILELVDYVGVSHVLV